MHKFDASHSAIFQSALSWISATEPKEPPKDFYCSTRDVLLARLEHCRHASTRSGMPDNQSYLFRAVVGEIGGNSFDHNLGAWKDISGAFFRWGEENGIFVAAIADRGQGVLATLCPVKPSIKTDEEALKAAFLEQLSGRAPEKRGNGLKFVRRVLLEDGIDTVFRSGNAEYVIEGGTEQWGKMNPAVSGCFAVVTWKIP